jgi:hypothetical protein
MLLTNPAVCRLDVGVAFAIETMDDSGLTSPETRFPFYSIAIGQYMDYFSEFKPYRYMNITPSDTFETKWIITIPSNNSMRVDKLIDEALSVYIPPTAFEHSPVNAYIEVIVVNRSIVNINTPPAIITTPGKTYEPPVDIIIINMLTPNYVIRDAFYVTYKLTEIIDAVNINSLQRRRLLADASIQFSSINIRVYHLNSMGE